MKLMVVVAMLSSLVACGQKDEPPVDLVPPYDGVYAVDGTGATQLNPIERMQGLPGASVLTVVLPGSQKPEKVHCYIDAANTLEEVELVRADSFKYFAFRNKTNSRISVFVPVEVEDGSEDVVCRASRLEDNDFRIITEPGLSTLELVSPPEVGHLYHVYIMTVYGYTSYPVLFE